MSPTRFVYDFDEPSEGGRELLGGKGIGLAEMTQLGVPVPAGFTITTDACRAYMAAGSELPDGLEDEVDEHLARLEEKTGKRFGDPADPLLVSVRSGAAVSMPGMMDTILNLGLNDDAVKGLAERTGNPRFANDSYRRLIQMYGEVVDGIPDHLFEDSLTRLKNERGASQDVDLSAEDLAELVETYKASYERETGAQFPQDARDQLTRAVRGVFDSWETPRAQVYRRAHHIPDDLGTAVNVVQMVFGNKGEQSGTGVAFTRDPSTGEAGLYGEFLVDAQGEDVVAGIRTPEHLAEMEKALPEAFEQLTETMRRLEEHYRDVQDIEFTVEDGRLYLLQTRSAKRTAAAALKSAVDMVEEGLISREDAVARIDSGQLDQLLHPMIDPTASVDVIAQGLNASPGAASGKIVFDADTAVERGTSGDDVILVRWETTPDDIHGMIAAKGILTAHGGMTSHAAVVARGMGKPCVAGCEALSVDVAAKKASLNGHDLGEGDLLTIDGGTGRVILGSVPARPASDQRGLRDDPRLGRPDAPAEGARERRHARGRGQGPRVRRARHRPLPHRAHVHGRGPAPVGPGDDHGLGRGGAPSRPREALAPPAGRLRGDLRGDGGSPGHDQAARPAAPRVPARPRRGHRRPNAGADPRVQESNPMLGTRGCRLGLMWPEIYEMQVKAILRAAVAVEERTGDAPLVEIMHPLVGFGEELKRLRAITVATAAEEQEAEYLIGTMIELPRACIRADEIAEHADFFSFGTNDLTQTALGFSRDDAEGKFLTRYLEDGVLERNPFETLDQSGVGDLMQIAVERGRSVKEDMKMGICGEHGGEPESVAFCHRLGLDYVSCSPYRVPLARLAAAQASLKESGIEAVATGG